jgi:hypothetical protein
MVSELVLRGILLEEAIQIGISRIEVATVVSGFQRADCDLSH